MEGIHFVSAAAIVQDELGRVLLVKSPRRGWEFPGGLVEYGEGLTDALKREIREESGVEVTVTGIVGVCKNLDKNSVNMDFCCRYTGGELRESEESTQVEWVEKESVLEYVTDPLVHKRLTNMLSGKNTFHYFSFRRNEAFEVVEEQELPLMANSMIG